jgi:DTW domain-containing protein YfiP
MPRLKTHRSGRCAHCFFRFEVCLCDQIPCVSTSASFTVLRHYSDANSPTNTTRLARLAMPELVVHDYGHLDLPPFDPSWLPEGRLWLLFPPDDEHPPPAEDAPPPDGVIVLDGSWRHARRMSRRHAVLQALPRFAPTTTRPERFRIRKPHFTGGMATLEAIAAAVAAIDGEETAAPLEVLFDEFVHRVRLQRGF